MLNKVFAGITVLVVAALVYLFIQVNALKPEGQGTSTSSLSEAGGGRAFVLDSAGLKIGYVNLDTLDARYNLILDKNKELNRERANLERRMAAKMEQAEKRYQEIMTIASSMSQREAEEAQAELQQMQAEIQQYQQELSEELAEKELAMRTELTSKLNDYLDRYNRDQGYHYIISAGAGSPILLAHDSLDITLQVLNGLNSEYAEQVSAAQQKQK